MISTIHSKTDIITNNYFIRTRNPEVIQDYTIIWVELIKCISLFKPIFFKGNVQKNITKKYFTIYWILAFGITTYYIRK